MTPAFEGIEVRASPIDGLGMFAVRPFAPGERILRRVYVRDITPDAPIREDIGEHEYHCDDLAGGRIVLLSWPDRHFNHRCDPSAYAAHLDDGHFVVARRHIAAGEEITNDYAINGSGTDTWQCNCGVPSCRRTIHSDFFHLPFDKQAEYLSLLADWYVAEHVEDVRVLRERISAGEVTRLP